MRRLAILASMLVALFGLSACGEKHTWRQKTILEVETPNGIVTGGSVNEMTVDWFGGLELWINSSAVIARTRGEASFVEVAPNQYLFALLRDGEAFETAEVFREAGDNKETRPITARLEKLRERRTVQPSLYPMLVTFTDSNDPKTVQLVDPENLAATFGEGIELKGISVEITDEKVTEGAVERVLGWWNSHKGRLRPPELRLGPGLHPLNLVHPEELISHSEFVRGQQK